MSWADRAPCKGTPWSWWDLTPNYGRPPRQPAPEAEALCAACPVRDDCLADALDTGDATAYLAGTTPTQRRRIRRDRMRQQVADLPATSTHGTVSAYTNHACRCEPCSQANTARARDNYRKRQSAA